MRISHRTLALLCIEEDREAEDLLNCIQLETPVYWTKSAGFYSIWDRN
jgi:hypothetical protein